VRRLLPVLPASPSYWASPWTTRDCQHNLDSHVLEEWLLHKFVPLYLLPCGPELNSIEIICKQKE
jgi:hypothetical protein